MPTPGKNLPDDWESAPLETRWLYTLFIGLDANFRMKHKKVSSEKADPGLNHGCAYFVEMAKYKEFLDMFGTLHFEESTTCNNHDALKLAHMKGSQGTDASSIACVECTRHDMKRPSSIGDLQKGERAPVRTGYSFNLTINVGRTDGEAVERGWAAVNPFASSTKEMGPGARRNLLDDVFGDYNWRKCTQLPRVLLTKIKEAGEERNEQMLAFQEFEAALPAKHVARWKKAVEIWEKDPTQCNPFVATRPNITLAAARLRLAEEEAAAIASGESITVHDKASQAL
ncbi:hypothetical protein A0H81_09617 [Grifola frondosa]|uniref:Uncharacterized protein n=1 Tax=Grifola frondosa TaxID=5627 RepID=A0A1C7M024_GRIFR|nr:hypothetical protein A0H81_09617 [Grifola frondosa]